MLFNFAYPGVTPVVAQRMADRQVLGVTVAPFRQRLDMLERGCLVRHMFTTDPARHPAMQLPENSFVDFVAGQG